MPPPGQAAAVDVSLPLVRVTPKSSRSGQIAVFTTAEEAPRRDTKQIFLRLAREAEARESG